MAQTRAKLLNILKNMNDSIKNCSEQSCICHRRKFLKLLTTTITTTTLTLPFLLLSNQTAKASETKALVLTCIDFRFVHFQQEFLSKNNLDNQYDWLALAGASLALASFPSPAETQTFWEQLDLSYRLHHIEKVIIFDHEDCGAYASKVDPQLSQDSLREEQVHREYLNNAYWSLKERYPNLQVELYFVKLNQEFKAILPTNNPPKIA